MGEQYKVGIQKSNRTIFQFFIHSSNWPAMLATCCSNDVVRNVRVPVVPRLSGAYIVCSPLHCRRGRRPATRILSAKLWWIPASLLVCPFPAWNETFFGDSEDCRRRQVRSPTRTCRHDRRPLPVACPLLVQHQPPRVRHSLRPHGLKPCLAFRTKKLSQKNWESHASQPFRYVYCVKTS